VRGRSHRWRWKGCSRRAVRFLEPTLLLLLHHAPSHGYTLLERLAEFGLEDLDPSMVYRTLRDMESRGWVTSLWDDEQSQGPPRRVYYLSAEGDEALALWIQDLEETARLVSRLLEAYRHHMEEGKGEYH